MFKKPIFDVFSVFIQNTEDYCSESSCWVNAHSTAAADDDDER